VGEENVVENKPSLKKTVPLQIKSKQKIKPKQVQKITKLSEIWLAS